jgi:hypothetical protein
MIRYQLARTTVFVSLHMDCVYMYAEARQARHMRGLPPKTPAAGRLCDLCRFTTLLGSCPINVKLGPNSAFHLIYRVLAASWWNSAVIARISGMSSDGSQEEGIATGWLQIHTLSIIRSIWLAERRIVIQYPPRIFTIVWFLCHVNFCLTSKVKKNIRSNRNDVKKSFTRHTKILHKIRFIMTYTLHFYIDFLLLWVNINVIISI